MRLDMKVNLLLDMVGALLVASRPRPRAAAIRFNALGGVWQAAAPFPELGSQGVLEIYLRDCIAEPLRLVGRIASVGPDGRVKVRFVALEREHRRPAGEARVPQASPTGRRHPRAEEVAAQKLRSAS